MSELTPKQVRFVNEYIKTLNITQSAIKAGYAPNSAHVTGSRLLRNEKVSEYIKSQQEKVMDDSILTAKELLHLLTNAAVGDETETKEVVVKRSSFERNPDTQRLNLVYNEHVELVEVPIKPSDRLKARDMLGKYHKLFTEKHEIAGGMPIFLNVDKTDVDEDELNKEVERIANQYPNNPVIIDDIPLKD